jgi:hypothetical protein
MLLTTIHTMLGLQGADQEEKINTIVELTESRLKVLLGGVEEVPAQLEYIVAEVSIRRFNRVGSEGLASHTVEGESMSWTDDDFEPFEQDIQDYLSAQAEPSTYKGRVRFL